MGSLSPETSVIPVNSYQSGVQGKLQQLLNVNRILFLTGQAQIALQKGSGSCSAILCNTLAVNSVSWVN